MPLFKKKPHDGTSQPLIPPPEPTSPPAYAPSAPVPSSSYQPRLASLSFHMTDRIRLLHFPPEAIDVCRSTILSAWKPPHSGAIVIQDERPYGASHEFKLRGFPWALGSYQPVESSRLVCALLSTLHGLGWTLILTTDVTRKMRDKDTLVFRRRRMCLWSVTGAWSCFREATGCGLLTVSVSPNPFVECILTRDSSPSRSQPSHSGSARPFVGASPIRPQISRR